MGHSIQDTRDTTPEQKGMDELFPFDQFLKHLLQSWLQLSGTGWWSSECDLVPVTFTSFIIVKPCTA